jgi:hypothetical protein
MSVDSYAATAVDSVIHAAGTHDSDVEIQWHSGDPMFINFDATAVENKGIKIWSGAPYYKIASGDPRLLQDVHAICAAGGTQAGGINVL